MWKVLQGIKRCKKMLKVLSMQHQGHNPASWKDCVRQPFLTYLLLSLAEEEDVTAGDSEEMEGREELAGEGVKEAENTETTTGVEEEEKLEEQDEVVCCEDDECAMASSTSAT